MLSLINPLRPDLVTQVEQERLLAGIEAIGGLEAAVVHDHCRVRLRPLDGAFELLLAEAVALLCRKHLLLI